MAKATSGAAADAEFPIHWKEFHPKNFWQRIKACHSMISAVQKHECNLVEKFSYQSSVEDEPPQGKAEEPSKEKGFFQPGGWTCSSAQAATPPHPCTLVLHSSQASTLSQPQATPPLPCQPRCSPSLPERPLEEESHLMARKDCLSLPY
uniref:uncharacterized protein LOC103791347 isoform X5 n=1 Tax=Callithrix jacchus TaxID=9483 RepID=UPI0023DCF689|nr:uncharacterized protein LOC103791347 isoform X5 [Callithrix jacchus]